MEQWRQIIQECRNSGLSNKGYQKRHIIYWLQKVRKEAVKQAAMQIMELEPKEEGRTEALYIWYWGAELTLPAGTDMEAAAAVLRSLQRL